MAGLLNPQKGDMPIEGNQLQQADDSQQAVYEQFIDNGLRLIHDENGMTAIMRMVDSANPVEGLANALLSVLTRLKDTSEKQGIDIPKEAYLQGGAELMAEIADLAEEAKVHEFEKDELEVALAMGLQLFTMQADKGGKQQPGMTQPGGKAGMMPTGA